MAQFKFMTEMNNLLTVDGPLTKGPPPRWQRKNQENLTISNMSLNSSKHKSMSTSLSYSKSPSRNHSSADGLVRTRKTPSKTPSKNKSTTPTSNKVLKTPVADRFIPVRSASNFELAHYRLNQKDDPSDSPSQKELQKAMCESLHGTNIDSQKILSYREKPPTAPEGFQNPMRVIYTHTKTPASAKSNTRYIPQAPDRILDAPDIVDDYYLNLMDWGSNNILAAALGSHVYLWNAGNSLQFRKK